MRLDPVRFFRLLGLVYMLGFSTNLSLAKITPPPPNIQSGVVRISEDKWTKDTNVEVIGNVKLTADREVKGLLIDEKSSSAVNLNGKLMTVGAEGITFRYGEKQPYVRGGRITSSGANLVLKGKAFGSSQIDQFGNTVFINAHLNSAIQDHKNHRIGLVMTGSHPIGEMGLITLSGNQANTFTGDVIVEGSNTLFLGKADGVTSIQGNAYVKNGGRLALSTSDQISDTATVTLSGNKSMFSFTGNAVDNVEKIHSLVVDRGSTVFNFVHPVRRPDDASRTLFLDDLIIKDGASLQMQGWKAGRDHLLVRKDSKHLEDALKKLSIDGWAKNQIYLKDYDKDYWSIEAAPEPSTYGAILGAVGLGIVALRKRRGGRGVSVVG